MRRLINNPTTLSFCFGHIGFLSQSVSISNWFGRLLRVTLFCFIFTQKCQLCYSFPGISTFFFPFRLHVPTTCTHSSFSFSSSSSSASSSCTFTSNPINRWPFSNTLVRVDFRRSPINFNRCKRWRLPFVFRVSLQILFTLFSDSRPVDKNATQHPQALCFHCEHNLTKFWCFNLWTLFFLFCFAVANTFNQLHVRSVALIHFSHFPSHSIFRVSPSFVRYLVNSYFVLESIAIFSSGLCFVCHSCPQSLWLTPFDSITLSSFFVTFCIKVVVASYRLTRSIKSNSGPC